MSIFVSYRRDDSQAITGRIDDHLRKHFGNRGVFRDIDSIPAGVDFVEHLEVALAECDVCVVVIGKRWTSQRLQEPEDYVRIELEHALGKGIPVIPVLVEGASVPSGEDLPEKLRPLTRRQALRVDSGSDFRPHVDALVRSIRQNRKTDEKRRGILIAVCLAAALGVEAAHRAYRFTKFTAAAHHFHAQSSRTVRSVRRRKRASRADVLDQGSCHT
jgi:hypothetical protein